MAENGATIKGEPLRLPISVPARFSARIAKHIDAMTKYTEREVRRLFEADNYAGEYGMDANIGSQARILMNGLQDRFASLFIRISGPTVQTMVSQADKSSATSLKLSMFSISERLEISTDVITPVMKEMISAGTAEAVSLIRRVPAKYLDNIATNIYQAITSGNGLADIVPMLAKEKVKVKNWAHNTALDQVRKIYCNLNEQRMKSIGVEKYEWVHSGGSNKPREYHRDVLNGKIFRFDDPPIIDPKTKQRGTVGTLIHCRCTARPIVDFSNR